MPLNKLSLIAASGLAAAALLLAAGCAGKSQQNGARWLQRGEAEQLLTAKSAMAEADPDPDRLSMDASALEAQGDVMASQGASWSAMNQYRLALHEAKGPAKARLEGKIAGLDLRLGRFQAASDGFARLIAKQRDKAVFWQGLGLAQMGLNNLPAASRALQHAVEQDPSLWRAQNLLGVIYNRERQPQKAQAAFRAALESKPDNPALYNNLALSQMMLGDYPRAEANLRRALALDPEHRQAANNLGLLLMKQGRNEEAFQVFSGAVGVAQAHNNLGVYLAWQGQTGKAQRQFRLALESLPRYYPLAARHLNQIGDKDQDPANPQGVRPMVSLAEKAQARARAKPQTQAKAKARPKPRPVIQAKPAPKPAPKQAKAPARRPAQEAAPRAQAKPKPLGKPAPLSKAQRIAQDRARAQAEKMAASAAKARTAAQGDAQKARPQEEKASQAKPTPSPAKPATAAPSPRLDARGASQGLWIQPDGSLAYGQAPAGEQSYGVVFDAPTSQD